MPPRPGTLRSRWAAYAVLSSTLAAGVILKALAQRPNFYSAAVYLSQSSANLMILCNLVFVTACTCLLFLQQALYGPLRPIEVEQLYEKAWFAVTETCLAMTIFRGEIGAWFLVMFFSLLAGKVWGWIGEGRVEVLEQQQHNILAGPNSRFLHTRLLVSLALSVIFDMCMLDYTVGQVLHMARPDMMVMFGFEFAVLSVSSLSTAMRYALNMVEGRIVQSQRRKRVEAIRKERIEAAVREVQPQPVSEEGEAPPVDDAELVQRQREAEAAAAAQPIDEADVEVEGWEGKGRWIFYLDLTTDFCKLCIYLSFFFILLIFYGLPLHIMRDVFLTCRSFFKRIGDFVRYRNATRDMNERYPDATDAEIGREDVCIICREEMRPYVPPAQGAAADPVAERMRPKKLPCGHVLHFACLRSWLERQQICPTCRATVVPTPPTQQTAARAQAPAGRGQHPPNGGNGRPRVYQFGPLRIGVGAVRGNDLFEQLDQQLANINVQPADGPQGNGPQQYGFGIRWGGPRRRQGTGHRPARNTVEAQLHAIEQQIQREADSLQASLGELQALRNVQAQLSRIRMARQPQPAQDQQRQALTAHQQDPQARLTPPTVTAFRPHAQQNVLQAGSDQLPAGLTLPEGWSMMPLEPIRGLNMQQNPGYPPIPMQMPLGTFHFPGVPAQGQHTVGVLPPDPHVHQQPNSVRPSTQQPAEHPPQAPATASPRTVASMPTSGTVNTNRTIPGASAPLAARQNAERDAPAQTPASSTPLSQPPANVHTSVRNTYHPPSPVANRPPPAPGRSAPLPTVINSSSVSNTASARPASNSTRDPIDRANGQRNGVVTNPPRALGSSTTTIRRIPSPHRPTRSIGSSWGFSGAENVEGASSDETESHGDMTDSEQEGEKGKNVPRRANGERGSVRQPTTRKGKSPTVEDLVEDPD